MELNRGGRRGGGSRGPGGAVYRAELLWMPDSSLWIGPDVQLAWCKAQARSTQSALAAGLLPYLLPWSLVWLALPWGGDWALHTLHLRGVLVGKLLCCSKSLITW